MTDDRYARQTILAEIGEDGQNALAKTRVLIIGLGGLGSPASLYLAAAGVGHLGLIDGDRVAVSNLQRQVLFATDDAGELKVEAGKKRLAALNPLIEIQTYPEFLDESNALRIASSYDVLLDGSDNFATKELVNALACRLRKPMVYGSILRFEGRASVFWPQFGPCYCCLFPDRPETHIPNCAEAGVLGAMAGMVGSLQALETIKLALALKLDRPLEGLLGKLLVISPSGMRTLQVPRDPDCPVCSQDPADVKLPELTMGCATDEFDAKDLLQREKDYRLLDVREQSEWDAGHIEGAIHWPLSRLVEGSFPDKDEAARPIVIYCQSGVRSQKALGILKKQGWQRAKHLTGGYRAWLLEKNF